MKRKRIDPPTCGCTYCLIGDSVPLNAATQDDLRGLLLGYHVNATGYELEDFKVVIEPPEWRSEQ